MKKVSVIIPVYNVEKYFDKCMESVFNQTYTDLEIILVDDGSKDNSGKMCDEFALRDKRVKVIHKENGGVSSARNVALGVMTGEYVTFIDSDDFIERNHIEQLMARSEDDGVDLCITGHSSIYETNNETIVQNVNGKAVKLNRNLTIELMFSAHYFCGFLWNKLYSAKIIRENGIRFCDEISIAEDLLFNCQYALNIRDSFYNPSPTYNYIQRTNSATNKQSVSAKKLSAFKAYNLIIDLLKEQYPNVCDNIKATMYNMSLHYLTGYYNTNDDDKETLKLLKGNVKKYFKYYIKSKNYRLSHKVIRATAIISPKLYCFLRKIVKKG